MQNAIHGGKTLNGCNTEKQGNGVPVKKEDGTEKSYTLPSWRVSEIVLLAVQFLSDEEYWQEGFDYQKAITSKGILLKAYSAFKSENLAELHKVSLSLWDEGLCLVATDKETGEVCRMIAYNDAKNDAEVMQITFHEYAHIRFNHTEQSMHGEAEAILFSAIATFLMIAEKRFHIGRLIAQEGGKNVFFEGMRQGLLERFGQGGDMKSVWE